MTKKIRQTKKELLQTAKDLNIRIEPDATKAVILSQIESARTFDGEILEDEKTIVKEMAANLAEPEFIARKLGMDLDEFKEKYETVCQDAITERALGYSRMLHDLALSGDFKALKLMMQTLRPKENTIEIIGGRNKRMVTIKQHGVENRPLTLSLNVQEAMD